MTTNTLEQDYRDLLVQVLADLKALDTLPDAGEKEQVIQHIITKIEFAFEEAGEAETDDVEVSDTHSGVDVGHLHGIPKLLDSPLPDSPLFAEIKGKLLIKTVDIENTPILLEAAAGAGKSLIATQLAYDEEIQAAYPDGIFWFSLGQLADVESAYQRIAQGLGREMPGLIEEDAAVLYMQEILAAQHCLLILDDATNIESIVAFHGLGAHCRLLITTSVSGLYEFLRYRAQQALLFQLETPSLQGALHIFKQVLHMQQVSPPDNNTGKALLAYAGHSPLALQLTVGLAATQESLDWGFLLKRLQTDDWDFPEGHDPVLMRCLHLYLEALGEAGECYTVLAVFEDYSHIPQTAVCRLWNYMFNLSFQASEALIHNFAQHGLLHLHQQAEQTELSLHHFQQAYIVDLADLDKLHTHVLASYARECQQNWLHGKDDGYFYQHLCFHLAGAGRLKELKSLLLDFDWLAKKIDCCGLPSLLDDYAYLPNDADALSIQHALFASANALSEGSKHLASELLDKLWNKATKDIQPLLNQARESLPAWEPPMPDNDELSY